jgi:hypothetical protein
MLGPRRRAGDDLSGVFGGGHWYWTWRGGVVVAILGLGSLVGVVLALKSLVRLERFWGLTVAGMLVNAPFLLMLLWGALSQLIGWLQYG